MINDILKYNQMFVKNKLYEPYETTKYPDKKLAIVTCMDTRLLELLPAALGIKNGDAKIIKNAGRIHITQNILINAPLDIKIHNELIMSIFEYAPTPNVAPKNVHALMIIDFIVA